MKNKKNCLGILAIVLVFGMAVIGCTTTQNGNEDTYTVLVFAADTTQFNTEYSTVFTSSNPLEFITGDASLPSNIKDNYKWPTYTVKDPNGEDGLTHSEVLSFLLGKADQFRLSNDEISSIINKLKSDEYVVAVKGGDGSYGGVIVIIAKKE